MISGILDFFSGRSSENKGLSFKQHIVPIVHHDRQRLNYTDCSHWMGKRAALQLIKFERRQIGVIKYIGSDTQGLLCAGIEFDYDIGGMSGKVNGQKLFKCKQNHGLLVPVEYVQLLDDLENGTNIFPLSNTNSSTNISRTQSVPNLSGRNPQIEEYIAVPSLPGLKVGDNVVWLGGTNPQTGIVKWIGRAGQNKQLPMKAWIEMDDYMGYGHQEIDIGVRYGCAVGRGKFLPVDELILFENFVAQDLPSNESEPQASSLKFATISGEANNFPSRTFPNVRIIPITIIEDSNVPIANLIDLGGGTQPIESGSQNLADQDFYQLVMKTPSIDEIVALDKTPTIDNSVPSVEEILKEFCTTTSMETESISTPSKELTDIVEKSSFLSKSPESSIGDENGNFQKTCLENITDRISVEQMEEIKDSPVKHTIDFDYMPPFIVPPINIVDFFKANGQKGIQGRRNSCYIDVVLFSLFAFTDAFDPYFLVRNTSLSKGPDSELTRISKKILAEQIVNPLRQNYYVPASGVNFLRDMMIPLSEKIDGAFMDIEEFMLVLFDKVFNLKEFILYDNNMKDYLHQVNLGDHNLPGVMTVKQCLELSMADYGLQFKEIPSPCLIIEIPRNTYGIIQSTTIVPNLRLNLESVMMNTEVNPSVGLCCMNLLAVICIKEFHFVTFVKCGNGPLSHWVLFDSNPSEEKPKVEVVPNMGEWLESLEYQCLTTPKEVISNKQKLPTMVQKLLSDIYVCIYCPAYN